MWTNPAGKAFVDMDGATGCKTAEIDSALTLFVPSIRFSGENIVGATPTFGSNGGDSALPQWTTRVRIDKIAVAAVSGHAGMLRIGNFINSSRHVRIAVDLDLQKL